MQRDHNWPRHRVWPQIGQRIAGGEAPCSRNFTRPLLYTPYLWKGLFRGGGAKEFGMSFETHEEPGIFGGISLACSKSLRKKFAFNSGTLILTVRSCITRTDLRNKAFSADIVHTFKIRSYSARSDLENKRARFSGVVVCPHLDRN